MKVWTGDPRRWGPPPEQRSMVTIGVFDGVHEGHKALLDVMKTEAEGLGGLEPAVITFDVHPRSMVDPDRAPRMLTTLQHRLELLWLEGVERVGVLPFDLIRNWTPNEFVRRAVVGAFTARAVTVGKGFRFGADRSGDVSTLVETAKKHGFSVIQTDLYESGDGPVSSSAVRRCLAEGDVSTAADLLGRYHGMPARVPEAGRKALRSAAPAVELEINWLLAVPAPGAYTVWAGLEEQKKPYAGVCGIGAAVELHLPDGINRLAGQDIWITFTERLRGDPSLDDPARLEQDMALSRRLLDEAGLA